MRRLPIPMMLLSLLLSTPVISQETGDGDPVSIGTYRRLHSTVLREDRVLLVSLPEGYDKVSHSYPLLVVLYADQVRGYFAEAVHIVERLSGEGSIPAMIVVGVANVDRYRDLSPVGRRGTPSGIEPFSRFVVEELLPFVESEYRTKEYRILAGPQAGAEFGLYTLAKRPGVFGAFIIENPFRSDPVHDILIAAVEEAFEEGISSPTFLQITATDRAGFRDMTGALKQATDFQAMVDDRNPANLTFVADFVEESEDFLPPLGLKEGLRALFDEYRFPEEREVRGLSDLVEYYAALSGRIGFEVGIPEMTLVSSALGLKEKGAIASAEEILTYLVGWNPASLDGYWQLANLYREQGRNDDALAYYRKCVDLDPNMKPAIYWIEVMEGVEGGEE